ncbi:MAG: FG-GAP-like repeat-containing protein [Planctomycetota bacterium]|jgi:hypothetical protein
MTDLAKTLLAASLTLATSASFASAQQYWESKTIDSDLNFGVIEVHVGDFDGDEYPDVLSNDIKRYLNPQNTQFGGWVGLLLGHVGTQDAISVADLDGDGDDDFVVMKNAA